MLIYCPAQGLGPNAQEELQVGIGALAGSTIMLLTLPWCLAIFGGRVALDQEGRCVQEHESDLGQTINQTYTHATATYSRTKLYCIRAFLSIFCDLPILLQTRVP